MNSLHVLSIVTHELCAGLYRIFSTMIFSSPLAYTAKAEPATIERRPPLLDAAQRKLFLIRIRGPPV